jgi:hypothetical protein
MNSSELTGNGDFVDPGQTLNNVMFRTTNGD